MDGLTLAAAALAIAVDESRDAALRQAMLERERLAMGVEDRDSLLAQRFFVASMQMPGAAPLTWRAAHTRAHNEALEMRDVMDEARRALRRGHDDRALALLEAELDRDRAGRREQRGRRARAAADFAPLRRVRPRDHQRHSAVAGRAVGRSARRASMLCDDCEAAAQ